MSRRKRLLGWALIGMLLSIALPIVGILFAGFFFPEFRLVHIPLHSFVECAGGLIALAIAGILMVDPGHRRRFDHYPWMAAGLTSMGLLDLFHSASVPGAHFIWLHSFATFVGGAFFALVWLPGRHSFFASDRFQIGVAVVAIALGAVSALAPDILPAMVTSDGEFTTTALALNIIGGTGFLLAAAFFIARFHRAGEIEDWTFAVHTALFGAAGVVFAYSTLWDSGWWWWHLLRLGAYMVALTFGLRTFRDASKDLRCAVQRLAETNATLDQAVEERTARIKATEERFELAVRGSTDGLWDWDIRTDDVYYSTRMKELLGYRDEELKDVFATFLEHLHPQDHDWVLKEVEDHLKNRKPYDVEYRLKHKSGQYRWFRARGQALWNESGEAYRMAGSITDVTEEHFLRERFRLAVEASPSALLMVKQDGEIVMANSRCLSMFGYSQRELVGQKVELLVPERFRAEHPALRDAYFARPSRRSIGSDLELSAVRRSGVEFPVRIGLSPVETAEGLCVICGVMDITEQKETLEVMRQAKEAAESASRAKSSFLANMSHEIRTPMNGIIGMSQLLAQTELRSHQREYLATVEESAQILLRLLNDILDFSKIEAGKLELTTMEFRLSECIARASQMLVLRAAEKGLEIVCRVAPEIPDHLKGDPGRLQQVLVNLLGNAVKFTESGEIFVNVDAVSLTEERAALHFSVSDTGIGIPPDKLERIFHPFEQAESSTTRRFGGTGLGLTISRQLVEMMNGRMWVESEVDQGSAFHFTAEFEISADQHPRESAELDSLRDLQVLVVDDNLTNRRILSEMLRYWHMQPVLADSAEAARKALLAAAARYHPIRLILLDHHMPGEDGLHFASSLNELSSFPGCPIIMISSGSTPVDADLCQKLGIGRFMTKPVIASELLNEVLRQFGRYTTVRLDLPAEFSPQAVLPRKVLLVEDNEINRRVAIGLLGSRGHQVVMAENGEEAVEALQEQEFDVVLMDMQMPVMDGYEATEAIREREHRTGGHVPIVAMTAEALKGDRERCLEVGMDDYVAKPIAPAEMYRAIERFPAVCLVESTRPSRAAGPLRLPDDPGESAPVLENSPDQKTADDAPRPLASVRHPGVEEEERRAIDWEIARKRLNGGVEVLQEFSELIRAQIPQLMGEIHAAVAQNDAKSLRRAAHTLKGSVAYFGAEHATQAALELENLGKAGSFEGAPRKIEQLERELARFQIDLDRGPPDFTN